jgi:hypothetical protein
MIERGRPHPVGGFDRPLLRYGRAGVIGRSVGRSVEWEGKMTDDPAPTPRGDRRPERLADLRRRAEALLAECGAPDRRTPVSALVLLAIALGAFGAAAGGVLPTPAAWWAGAGAVAAGGGLMLRSYASVQERRRRMVLGVLKELDGFSAAVGANPGMGDSVFRGRAEKLEARVDGIGGGARRPV